MGATVLGLMSGTSADGVDAVLARFDGAPRQPSWRVINAIHHPYPLPCNFYLKPKLSNYHQKI